jgi:hypothetical protein
VVFKKRNGMNSLSPTGEVDPLETKFEKSPHWHFKPDNVVLQAKNGKGTLQHNSSASSLLPKDLSPTNKQK